MEIGELRGLGYTEVNLNLGCPSGTVTAKGKGSGMLRDPVKLDAFLAAVFANAEGPISVRPGWAWKSRKNLLPFWTSITGIPSVS